MSFYKILLKKILTHVKLILYTVACRTGGGKGGGIFPPPERFEKNKIGRNDRGKTKKIGKN